MSKRDVRKLRQFSDSALSCFIQVTGIWRFLLILLDPRSNVGKAVELSTRTSATAVEPDATWSLREIVP